MKKVMVALMIAAMATSAFALTKKRAPVGMDPAEGPVASGKEAKVMIEQFPKLSQQAWRPFIAPSLQGASNIGVCYTKPRYWTVLEAKYKTFAKTTPQLTFTWHVLTETKTATSKNKDANAKIPPYSYFTTTVTYRNIPMGSHAASVCLHPSYLETYGEPKAVGLVIANENGDVLGGDTVAEGSLAKFVQGKQFWDDPSIMEAKQAGGEMPMIERRQGLQDRSKTIWALVNPNDYENVLQ